MAARRRTLGQDELHEVAHFAVPRARPRLILADQVVHVEKRRGSGSEIAPGRLRLLQVEHVGVAGKLAHALAERASGKPAPRPLQPLHAPVPAGRIGRHPQHLDR